MPHKISRKMPRAENLLQLMEWNKLGRIYHIHHHFLEYLDINSMVSMCIISKHYYNKYLLYCLQHYFGTHVELLLDYRVKYFKNSRRNMRETIPLALSSFVYNNLFYQHKINKFKQMYTKNKKLQLMVDRFFGLKY
jgi:hypothetical protein|tara:strand:+ start:75 stop:482 length:408 start_codon:yes stop_codon:yes gene_type:complete